MDFRTQPTQELLIKIQILDSARKGFSGDEILLKYRNQLLEDNAKHRLFVTNFYKELFENLKLGATFFIVVLGFFGFNSFRHIKNTVESLYESQARKELSNIKQQYTNKLESLDPKLSAFDNKIESFESKLIKSEHELDTRIIQLESELEKQALLNARQEKLLPIEKQRLSTRFKITDSHTTLIYQDASGKDVIFELNG